MNIEDSWRYDVHDKCLALGLDPDSDRARKIAGAALLAERGDRGAKDLTPEKLESVRSIMAAFKASYGRFP